VSLISAGLMVGLLVALFGGGAALRVDRAAMYADQVLPGAQRSTTQDA
jgi:hypothetical protein